MTAEADALAVSLPAARRRGRRRPRDAPGWTRYRAARAEELRDGEARLARSAPQEVELGTAIAAGHDRLACCGPGELDDPRLHLHHASEPGAAGGHPPPRVRRGMGRAQRRAAIAALAVIVWFRILPPAAGDRRAARLVPRDRIVLRPQRHGARAQDHRRPGHDLGAHPRRRRTCASCSWPACSGSASCSSSTASARSGGASALRPGGVAGDRRRCAVIATRPTTSVRPPRGDPWASRPLPAP